MFQSLCEYEKAKKYTEKALGIRKEIGDREGEAADYGNLGTLFQSLCEYEKAKKNTEKALGIRKEIGDRKGEMTLDTKWHKPQQMKVVFNTFMRMHMQSDFTRSATQGQPV